MVRVACFHTAATNAAVFDGAARGLDVSLRHRTGTDLLARAEAAGGLTDAIADAAARRRLGVERRPLAYPCGPIARVVLEERSVAPLVLL